MGDDPLVLVYDNCCWYLTGFSDRCGYKMVCCSSLFEALLRKVGVSPRSCGSGSQARGVSLGAWQTWEREGMMEEWRECSVNSIKGRRLSQQTGQEEVEFYELSNPIINTIIKLFKIIKNGIV